jgi:hypothetical protein
VQWTVHLNNKKAAWYKFFTWGDHKKDPDLLHHKVRNCDVRVPTGQLPDSRGELVIDPGPRCIDGCGNPGKEGGRESASFDTGTYRGTCVPLGELRIDGHGRLLVLGGFGKSGSTTIIRSVPTRTVTIRGPTMIIGMTIFPMGR